MEEPQYTPDEESLAPAAAMVLSFLVFGYACFTMLERLSALVLLLVARLNPSSLAGSPQEVDAFLQLTQRIPLYLGQLTISLGIAMMLVYFSYGMLKRIDFCRRCTIGVLTLDVLFFLAVASYYRAIHYSPSEEEEFGLMFYTTLAEVGVILLLQVPAIASTFRSDLKWPSLHSRPDAE